MVKCLKDNNIKVVTAAQDIFTNILPNIKMLIEKGATLVIEGLTANVVNSNSMIRSWGRALMKKLVLSEELEWSVFIQPMWHQILQGKAKARSIILGVLWEVLEIVYEVKAITVTKHIYSLWSKLMDDVTVKGDTKKGLYQVMGKWYELAGDSFVSSFPTRHSDKVWTILKNETNSIFST